MSAADPGVKTAIRRFIEDDLFAGAPPSPIADDTDLLGTGVLDSVTVVMLVAFLEERFGVRLGDEHLVKEHLESIDRLGALIASLGAADGARAPAAGGGS